MLKPSSIGNDGLHRRVVDAKLASHGSHGCALLNQSPRFLDRQSRQAVATMALSRRLATLGIPVSIVDRPGSSKEVVLADTRRVIAGVADINAVWRPAVEQGPGESVGQDHRVAEPEDAIAIIVTAGRPDPASITMALADLRPKANHGSEDRTHGDTSQ